MHAILKRLGVSLGCCVIAFVAAAQDRRGPEREFPEPRTQDQEPQSRGTQARPSTPELVHFQSADGRTKLDGYLYRPRGRGRAPAVIMLHGRAGLYSSAARGKYNAETLSRRHKMWGEFWSQRGYVALLVDSFGPRGHAGGFQKGTYEDRPSDINEVTIRPLDAQGALRFLRGRQDVAAERVALQGWSNGASATLAAMAEHGRRNGDAQGGFRVALALYPACGLQGHFDRDGYKPYAPVHMFHGTADEEVSFARCKAFVERSRKSGGTIDLKIYEGATHGFDDPNDRRQRDDANARALADVMVRAERIVAQALHQQTRSQR